MDSEYAKTLKEIDVPETYEGHEVNSDELSNSEVRDIMYRLRNYLVINDVRLCMFKHELKQHYRQFTDPYKIRDREEHMFLQEIYRLRAGGKKLAVLATEDSFAIWIHKHYWNKVMI